MINLRFNVKVEKSPKDRDMYDTPISHMTHGGLHVCERKKSRTKSDKIHLEVLSENSSGVSSEVSSEISSGNSSGDSKEEIISALQFKAECNNIHLAACDDCLMYSLFIEVPCENVLTSTEISCPDCGSFYKYAQINNIKYHFCEKCHDVFGSGPAIHVGDKKQFQEIRSKSVICITCKGYCIKYDMNRLKVTFDRSKITHKGDKYYICDKCNEYRGYIRKNGEKDNLIDAYLD
jgi:hypothetical protein